MKKRLFTMLLALLMCLTLIPASTLAAENVAMVDVITIRFERAGHTYEMTFTNVANVVVNYTEDGYTWPNTIFYYPGTTVSVSENLDNTDNFLNGFYGEADFHPGEAGMVKANTQYSVEAKYAEIFYLICGKDAHIEDSTGILGVGPLFLVPWSDDNFSWKGYQETLKRVNKYAMKIESIIQQCNKELSKEENKDQVDVIDQISKLADMKEKGIITDEEFGKLKSKLI